MTRRPFIAALFSRAAAWLGILLVSGFLAAVLARMAPGFDMDERLLDARLGSGAREAIVRERAGAGSALRDYVAYLGRLARGDLGTSVSLQRPVRELVAERAAITLRSAGLGLGAAWLLSLAAVVALEWRRRPALEAAAAAGSGALLCVPAAVAALACVYAGAGPAAAMTAILLPRIFRYARGVAARASGAPHVIAAHAYGVGRARILGLHAPAPVLPDLAALAGVSVSMAIGAAIPAEALCGSPGVGQLVWQAALARDLPVLLNVTLVITALATGANLLADAARAAREAR